MIFLIGFLLGLLLMFAMARIEIRILNRIRKCDDKLIKFYANGYNKGYKLYYKEYDKNIELGKKIHVLRARILRKEQDNLSRDLADSSLKTWVNMDKIRQRKGIV